MCGCAVTSPLLRNLAKVCAAVIMDTEAMERAIVQIMLKLLNGSFLVRFHASQFDGTPCCFCQPLTHCISELPLSFIRRIVLSKFL